MLLTSSPTKSMNNINNKASCCKFHMHVFSREARDYRARSIPHSPSYDRPQPEAVPIRHYGLYRVLYLQIGTYFQICFRIFFPFFLSSVLAILSEQISCNFYYGIHVLLLVIWFRRYIVYDISIKINRPSSNIYLP